MPEPAARVTPLKREGPLETRWPCPVCVGVAMDKVHVESHAGKLTLDYCPRCGGLWFERGEVGELAKRESTALHQHVPARAQRMRPPCVGCHTPLDRDAERCLVCGERNVLDCPMCDRPMERRAHAGLVLDFCKHCHGVWFDNAELSAVWRMSLAEVAAKRSPRRANGSDALVGGGDALIDAMIWAPDLVFYGGAAAVDAAGAAAGAAAELFGSGIADGAGAAAEAVGSAAEGVFAVVVEIIAGLFDGL